MIVTMDEVLEPAVEAGVVALLDPDVLEVSTLEVADVFVLEVETIGHVVSDADVLDAAFVLDAGVLDETFVLVAEVIGQVVSDVEVLDAAFVLDAGVLDETFVLVAEVIGQVVSEAEMLVGDALVVVAELEVFILDVAPLDEVLLLVAEVVDHVVSETDGLDDAFVLLTYVVEDPLVLVALDEAAVLDAELDTTVDAMDDLGEVWLPDVMLD